MTLYYQPSEGPSAGARREQPGTRALQNVLLEYGGTDLGIYNPRKVAGSTSWSVHAEGRAGDIGLNAFDRDQNRLGWEMCWALASNAEALGIQYITWDGQHWGGRELNEGVVRWRARRGNPHTDHIHYEQVRYTATTLTDKSEIRNILRGEQDPFMTLTDAEQQEILQAVRLSRDALAPETFRVDETTPHNVAYATLQANGSIQNVLVPAMANIDNIVKTAVDHAFANLQFPENIDVQELANATSMQVIADIKGVWSSA